MPRAGTNQVKKATTSAATAPPTRAGGADGTGVPGGCVVGPGTMGCAVGACREGAGREDGAGAAVPSVNSCSRSQKARGLLLAPITSWFVPLGALCRIPLV